MTAIFIHLEDCGEENGGLVVFPGSHKLGPLQNHSDAVINNYVDQVNRNSKCLTLRFAYYARNLYF